MRRCVDFVKPDVLIHLGDCYDDGQVLAEEYPHIPLHAVAGNCDRYRCPPGTHELLCYSIGDVMTLMTHGHNQAVKSGIGGLVAEAKRYGASLALYGHTHKRDCRQIDDLWVMNPGACGSFAGSAGVVKISDSKVQSCYFITAEDLEAK